MKELRITYYSLDDLKPYENNPRLNDNAVDYVANSIREFGFKNPIIIDENNVIIAGHTRYKASKKLNLDKVPCIKVEDLTDEQVKAYRLADNKVGEIALWDMEALNVELSELDMNMEDFGFLKFDLKEELVETQDDDFKMDEHAKTTIKQGDIFQLGNHRLMCGDSTSQEDLDQLLDGNEIDLVVTDPPYNVNYEGKTEDKLIIQNDKMGSDEFLAFLTAVFSNIERILKHGSSFYIWYASREHINFETALKNNQLEVRQMLIWNKNHFVMGRSDYQNKFEPCLYGWKSGASHNWYSDRSQTTVLDFAKPLRNDVHPTMKPIPLIAYQIQNSSKKNDCVLDLFGGSGTTIIACEQTQRKCFMMELDPKYCQVIINRWETFTNEKAVKINGKTEENN